MRPNYLGFDALLFSYDITGGAVWFHVNGHNYFEDTFSCGGDFRSENELKYCLNIYIESSLSLKFILLDTTKTVLLFAGFIQTIVLFVRSESIVIWSGCGARIFCDQLKSILGRERCSLLIANSIFLHVIKKTLNRHKISLFLFFFLFLITEVTRVSYREVFLSYRLSD